MSNEKRKKSKGPLLFIVLVLLVGLLLGGMKLGIIPGGEAVGLTPESDTPTTTPDETQSETAQPEAYTIRVDNDQVYLDDELVTLEELEARIQSFNAADEITLIDAQAIKATYESVVTTLEESGLEYTSAQE